MLTKPVVGSIVIRRCLLGLAILFAVYQIGFWLPFFWFQMIGWQDTWCYYGAARAVLEHRSIYIPLTAYTPQDVPSGYLYFPQLAVILAPIAALGPAAFSRAWLLILVFAYWVFAWSLSTISQGRGTWRGTLIWGLAIACVPTVYHCLSNRNADIILWAMIGLAFATRRTGAWLAAVVQVKTYAVPALALFLWENRNKWREASTVVIAGFALSLCAGLSWPVLWYRTVAPIAHQGTFWPGNVSWSMGVLRIAAAFGWHYPSWLLGSLCVILEVVAVVLALRWPAPYRYIVLLVLSALTQPLCWDFYLTSALVVVAMLIRDTWGPAETNEAPDFSGASSAGLV